MLLQLNIKNFALIESLSIEFDKGFNVFLGETGSGKSILIDAIDFVLGSKFNKNLIRTGENKTYVEAIFTIENEQTIKTLNNLGIEFEDMVILSRETFKWGKSIAKANGKAVMLTNLREISETLIDIHGQHENQKLLKPASHIQYLDYYEEEKILSIIREYKKDYSKIVEIEKSIKDIEENKGDNQRKLEFLKYQIDDIHKANLKCDEDKELEDKFKMLSNAERIQNVLSDSYDILSSSQENYTSVFDNLCSVIKNLKNIENDFEKINPTVKSLEESYYIIEQNIHDLSYLKDTVYYDKSELEYINQRLYEIEGYKKKYGKTINDILDYKENMEKQCYEIENGIQIIEELKEKKASMMDNMCEQCKIIHEIRCASAEELEKSIAKEFIYVGLEKVKLKVYVKEADEFNERGKDKVTFCISTNPGEPFKPLNEIVSGGELSRIMLSLKSIFIHKDNIPTVIFDEVDTGISGRIAQSVGEKIYMISKTHQVFCVTHLPQIASICDNGYLVSKEVIDDKTYTSISKMTYIDKQYTIAKMIGGSEITELSLSHSKEMMNMAKEKKETLLKMAN